MPASTAMRCQPVPLFTRDSRGAWQNFAFNRFARGHFSGAQIECNLQIHPALRIATEVTRKPQCGIRCDGATFAHNVINARSRYAESCCQRVRCHADGCKEILALSPTCIKIIKRSLYYHLAPIMDRGMGDLISEVAPGYFATGEQEEGVNAFVEKRKPDFSRYR